MQQTIEEYNRIRSKLITLDSSILADALLKLALRSNSASMLVESLASTPKQNVALFKQAIHDIKKYGYSGEQILEILRRSLDMLDVDAIEPLLGLELMVSFYETDSSALESSTELDWDFEVVFTQEGFEKFAEFARKSPDEEHVVALVKRLYADDQYGMRTKLFDEASAFLSEGGVKALRS